VPVNNDDLISKICSIRQMAMDSLACLRVMIYDLRPAILDDLGLIPAIRWFAQTNLENAGIQVELSFPDEFPALPQSLTTTLFRITQEGVNNIIRHSHAKFVVITLGADGNEVYLHIQDDGQGFKTISSGNNTIDKDHWGLVGIQERIELVGGKMTIKSAPEQGTRLSVYAPLQRAEV
jgi:signal transduction histidine kinase